MTTKVDTLDQELAAVKTVYGALVSLDDKGRQFVLKTVADRLGSSLPAVESREQREHYEQNQPPQRGFEAPADAPPAPAKQTPKDFLRAKQPKSEVHRIACLAYYLTHSRNQPEFKTGDLSKLNSDAGQPRMSNASVTVANAQKGGFVTPVGRGLKQITTLGEDLVKALPNEEAVKIALQARRKPRKKRAKKAAAP